MDTVKLLVPRGAGQRPVRFIAKRESIMMSQTVRDMLENMEEDVCVDDDIPLPELTPETTKFILEYCDAHATAVENKAFDQEFLAKMTDEQIFDVLMGANYLNIPPLLNLISAWVGKEMSGRTVEEIRDRFKIVNDFTPEEEARIREENAWAFE